MNIQPISTIVGGKLYLAAVCLLAVLMLPGCATQQRSVEMPYGLEDQDALRVSPCACVEYTEFNNRG